MRGVRFLALVAATALVIAACGDDDTGEAATTTPATQQTTATSSTAAPTTTTAATTAAPTTTTTAPIDAHPIFGLSWDAVWPADGATAVYRIHDWSGAEEDVPARFDVGVDFMGETFDRITIGIPGGGHPAMEVYLDRSVPWKLGIKAVVTYSPHVAAGPAITELFEEPVFFDGTLSVDESAPVESEVILDFGNDQDAFLATYAFVVREIGATVEVPLGTVIDTLYAQGTVSGEEFLGGTEPFAADIWLHPQHMIVKMTGSPSFDMFEIVETWG